MYNLYNNKWFYINSLEFLFIAAFFPLIAYIYSNYDENNLYIIETAIICNIILLGLINWGTGCGNKEILYYDIWEIHILDLKFEYKIYYKFLWLSWHELEVRLIWLIEQRVILIGI